MRNQRMSRQDHLDQKNSIIRQSANFIILVAALIFVTSFVFGGTAIIGVAQSIFGG